MPFEGLTSVSERNHVLDGGQGRTNPFAATRGDKTAMRPFVKILWPLVFISTTFVSPQVIHKAVLSCTLLCDISTNLKHLSWSTVLYCSVEKYIYALSVLAYYRPTDWMSSFTLFFSAKFLLNVTAMQFSHFPASWYNKIKVRDAILHAEARLAFPGLASVVWPAITFPAAGRHRPFTGIELYLSASVSGKSKRNEQLHFLSSCSATFIILSKNNWSLHQLCFTLSLESAPFVSS